MNLSMSIDPRELYSRLESEYFSPIEKIIRTRFPPYILTNRKYQEIAEAILDNILMIYVKNLENMIPGCSLYWDDQIEIKPSYNSYPSVILDVVDGARNLLRGGTEVTSTFAILSAEDKVQLAIVSYPFAKKRYVNFDGEVFCYYNKNPRENILKYGEFEAVQISPQKAKLNLADLRISERYDVSPTVENPEPDHIRKKLDALRSLLKNSIKRPVGSIAKRLLSVITGSSDIYIGKRKDPILFHDYIAPVKIIQDLNGVVTDIEGNKVIGKKPLNGIIAASSKDTFELFFNFLNST